MEERAMIDEYRALGASIRPCLCPLMKRIKLLEAANLYQLVVARKQNWQGISYKDACWMAYYTVRERWGDHYPFWDDDFGLDVHQDVIHYFESKENGATFVGRWDLWYTPWVCLVCVCPIYMCCDLYLSAGRTL